MSKLVVTTPIGNITANETGNPDYPGVSIAINGLELLLVEYDDLKDKHVIRVWDQDNPDNDYVYSQEIEKQIQSEDEEDEDSELF